VGDLHSVASERSVSDCPNQLKSKVHYWLSRVENVGLCGDRIGRMSVQEVPIGAKAQVAAGIGHVRWTGTNPKFSTGQWVGIEL
jgi:hypothetical protein